MRYGISWAIAAAVAVAAPAVAADPDTAATFDALRQVDGRMAAIAYRLTTANAPLCRSLAPTPGWAIHSLGQYDPALRDQARASFGFETPIAVEAVVPGSAAAKAGVRAGDSIVSVDGRPIGSGAPGKDASSAARDAAVEQIAGLTADRPLAVELMREGRTRTVTIPASPGCRSAFEVLLGPGMTASADGRIVQIGVRFFERYTDDEVAVVVAHELSHNILRHAARLEAAGVKRGLLSEVGRNGRLFRLTEDQADLLGAYLLRNAGYDSQIAVRFWREHGGDVDGGLFRSRTHPSSSARAKALETAIATMPAGHGFYAPPLAAEADRPLQ
ncbi:peptidase M48 family protein [Sphingomonas melonis TY]|nr:MULTISPECIES: M48 family metallopeptidase [Sphingomonas]AOW23388.1 peptidase M48 family protein [Sphingomonas melonis TY]ATI54314.1 peptidase M48 family protein [Sphingomonas melonis]KZB93958.1 peptidase M48 family protein [Sphingomonas melonis TY]MBI0532173.1 PDZ domain-containing protein [Sphingomonas sp. TX0522]MBX8845833.1 M48 family metalloprotease [Sphingomonas melonis]